MTVQPGLCRTWSETPKTGFLALRLIYVIMTVTVTAVERFQAASEKNQESIQRHLQDGNDEDQSSEDEEDIGNNVLEKIFQTYSTTTGQCSVLII